MRAVTKLEQSEKALNEILDVLDSYDTFSIKDRIMILLSALVGHTNGTKEEILKHLSIIYEEKT